MGDRGHGPVRAEIDHVAGLLMAEWERVEHKPVNVSCIATFADMARVVIADTAAKHAQLRSELAEAHEVLTAALQRGERLMAFVAELAEEDCSYNDDCPSSARHYRCLRCKALAVKELTNG